MAEKTFAEILEDATNRSRDMDAPLCERLKAVADEVRRAQSGIRRHRRPHGRAARGQQRRTERPPSRRTDAGFHAAGRGRSPRPPHRPDRERPRGSVVPSRPLVPLLPPQCRRARRNCPRGREARRPDRGNLSRKEPIRSGVEGRHMPGRRSPSSPISTMVTPSSSTCCSGSATRSARRCGPAVSISPHTRATRPGCCRSRPPSSSAATAS